MGKTKSFSGNPLLPDEPALPCGLIAKTFFNDIFTLNRQGNTKSISIDQKNIAWNVDIDFNYKQTKDANSKAWIDVTDEHFMVWMRTSGMGRFKKLWGRIREDLPAGKYTVIIDNQYNSSEFSGTKSILMTTSSPFG